MFIEQPPWFYRALFPQAIFRMDPNERAVYLTFDDGPHPKYTEQLLDGLKERNVVATFFVTGENAENYPEIIRREQEEGHLIGNHTYSHIQLTSKQVLPHS